MSRFKFFEEKESPVLPDHDLKTVSKDQGDQIDRRDPPRALRYRAEQVVATKLNGVVTNNATTKREFLLNSSIKDGVLIVHVSLTDNVIDINPQQLSEAMNLISDLDLIKCNMSVSVHPETGKIQQVLNHQEIIEIWEDYKLKLTDKYSFLRSDSAELELRKFIYLADVQIKDEKALISDVSAKLFFDLFFDKYLVNLAESYKPYDLIYNSQLFEEFPVKLHMDQEIIHENPEFVEIRKKSSLDAKELNLEILEQKYNEKFKPMLGYKFSSYNYEYQVREIINTDHSLIEEADVFMAESIRNNVEILMDYKLKRIE